MTPGRRLRAVGRPRHLGRGRRARADLGPALGAVAIGVLTSELRGRFGTGRSCSRRLHRRRAGAAGRSRACSPRGGAERQSSDARARPAPRAPPSSPPSRSRSTTSAARRRRDDPRPPGPGSRRAGIYCVIGPNGAGKTSTFNVLTGELPAQAGRCARRRPRRGAHRAGARRGIGRKFQIPRVFSELTIDDNLPIALWSGRRRCAI